MCEWSRAALRLTVQAGCVTILASGVGAQPFGSGTFNATVESGYWLANGAHHNVDLNNTSTAVSNATIWALENSLDPTAMTAHLVDGDNYDARVVDADYGPNFPSSWVDCPPTATTSGTHPNKVCHGQRVHWNLDSSYDIIMDTAEERREIACHELGHTVGLGHYEVNWDAPSCMTPPPRPQEYGPHDKDHIAAHYG